MMMTFAGSVGAVGSTPQFVPVFIPNTPGPTNVGNQPTLIGTSRPPGGVAGFDYSALNTMFTSPILTSYPQVVNVPIQTSYIGPNNQVTNFQTNYAFLPAVQPNQITTGEQLKTLPAVTSGSLGALMRLAGLQTEVSGVNYEGGFIPPALTLPINLRPGTVNGVANTGNGSLLGGGFNFGSSLGGGNGLLG